MPPKADWEKYKKPEGDKKDEEKIVALDEGDIQLLKTYGQGPYAAALKSLDNEIKEVKEQWEPQLDELISHISDAFADNFSKIQCAGEVGVHKDEDFELWAIQIKVKFRYVSSSLIMVALDN